MPAMRAALLLVLLSTLPPSLAWPEMLLEAILMDEDLHLSFIQAKARFSDHQAHLSPSDRLWAPQFITQPQLVRNLSSRSGLLKLNMAQDPSSFKKPDEGSAIRYRQVMHNRDDVQYVAAIKVGNQDMMGVLDTGSFELVVFSNACRMCGDREKLYAHKLSSTYSGGRLTATQSYGSGSVHSLEAFESVQIGPLKANHQKFWEATGAYMPVLLNANFQAIVGVGPPNAPADEAWEVVKEGQARIQEFQKAGIPVPSEVKQTVADDLEIAKWTSESTTMLDSFGVRLFSVCLGAPPLSDGYFVWNDLDPRHRPALFVRLPVAGRATWGVHMFEAELRMPPGGGGARRRVDLGCGKGCGMIVDSGTSLLAVPPAVVQLVRESLEDLHADCGNLRDMPTLAFRVGEHTLSLPPDAYIGRVVDEAPSRAARLLARPLPGRGDSGCRLLLMEQDAATQFGPMWIMGMPFFRKYYTTFDVGDGSVPHGVRQHRSLFVSLADSQCEPSEEPAEPQGGPALLGSKVTIRQVNASRLALPSWAEKAAEQRYMTI